MLNWKYKGIGKWEAAEAEYLITLSSQAGRFYAKSGRTDSGYEVETLAAAKNWCEEHYKENVSVCDRKPIVSITVSKHSTDGSCSWKVQNGTREYCDLNADEALAAMIREFIKLAPKSGLELKGTARFEKRGRQ